MCGDPRDLHTFPTRRSSDRSTGMLRAVQSGLGLAALPGYMGRELDGLLQVLPDLKPPRSSEEHTSELQPRQYLVCRLLLEKTNDLTLHIRILPLHTCRYSNP